MTMSLQELHAFFALTKAKFAAKPKHEYTLRHLVGHASVLAALQRELASYTQQEWEEEREMRWLDETLSKNDGG